MKDERVFVVGGGNSAGQAALHLASYAAQVTMLVRGPSLAETMSEYLVRELEATPEHHPPLQHRGRRRPRRWPALRPDPQRPQLGGDRDRTGDRAVRPHRGRAPHRLAPRYPRGGTSGASWSPAPTCSPTASPRPAGHWTGPRCRWRRACLACSRPATSATGRPSGSLARSGRARSPSAWSMSIWPVDRECLRWRGYLGLPPVTELLEGDLLAGLEVPGDEQVVEHNPGGLEVTSVGERLRRVPAPVVDAGLAVALAVAITIGIRVAPGPGAPTGCVRLPGGVDHCRTDLRSATLAAGGAAGVGGDPAALRVSTTRASSRGAAVGGPRHRLGGWLPRLVAGGRRLVRLGPPPTSSSGPQARREAPLTVLSDALSTRPCSSPCCCWGRRSAGAARWRWSRSDPSGCCSTSCPQRSPSGSKPARR